jgi:hypothetical protein
MIVLISHVLAGRLFTYPHNVVTTNLPIVLIVQNDRSVNFILVPNLWFLRSSDVVLDDFAIVVAVSNSPQVRTGLNHL